MVSLAQAPQTHVPLISDKLRDHILISVWVLVTFYPFRNDELLLYPLALYFAWSFARDIDLILPILVRSLIIFAFPLWCLLSALWGAEPEYIIRVSAQMFLTSIICYVAVIRLEPRDLILPMLMASALYGVLSFMVFLTGSGLAQRGVFSSKNAMGLAMVILWTSAICTALDRDRVWWLRLFAVGAAALGIFQVFIADSATAVLLAAGASFVVIVFGVVPRSGALRSPFFLTSLFGITALVFFVSAWFFAFNTADPVTAVLDAFGKDATLTGRTVLWQYAEDQIRQTPYLGVGAGGFWTPWDGSTTSRRIYDEFHKAYYAIFTFHNSYYEIAVHQGLIGLGIAVSTVVWLLWRLAIDIVRRNSIPTTFFVTFGMLMLATSMTEASLFTAFSLMSMLFVMGGLMSVKYSPAVRPHVETYMPGAEAGRLFDKDHKVDGEELPLFLTSPIEPADESRSVRGQLGEPRFLSRRQGISDT